MCGLRSKNKTMKFDETETRKASLGFDTWAAGNDGTLERGK